MHRHLERLVLSGNPELTDAGLETLLAALPELERLDLTRLDAITDRGVRAIARHGRLRELVLDYARGVTSEGLLALAELKQLEVLYLRGGKRLVAAQARGRAALREALPRCKVFPDG